MVVIRGEDCPGQGVDRVLSPSSYSLPVIDLLSESLDPHIVHTNPLSMPILIAHNEMGSRPASMDPGMYITSIPEVVHITQCLRTTYMYDAQHTQCNTL